MVLGAMVFVLAYVVLHMLTLVLTGRTVPLTVPLAGIVCSTALLETMAWSEERSRRRVLEDINSARQQMTDMLVHDLKRRVSSIQMSISLLRKSDTMPTSKNADLMTTLNTSVDRMIIQINALLDIRKIQEGKMSLSRRNTAIAGIVDDILKEYRPACELVNVSVSIAPALAALPPAYVDRDVFSRVIANLLWNALQHAPQGTEIRIDGESRGSMVSLSVANDGPQIPAETRAELFQPFSSGRKAAAGRNHGYGTGLGLAFCRLALEIHQGSILLQSPIPGADSGVRVEISVPAAM
jgi:signal transduction histidine kinase